jgi:hypothetical protein
MKHRIPLGILPQLSSILAGNLDKVVHIANDVYFDFHVVPREPYTGFFFKFHFDENAERYALTKKPSDQFSAGESAQYVNTSELPAHFSQWIKLVSGYAETVTIFDDPIQKKYEEDFFGRFQMVDEDANYAPFDIAKMLLLESHLGQVRSFIEDNRANFASGNEVETLISECNTLAEQLPSTPKNVVLRKLSSIYAKIVKNGLTVLKKFMAKFGDALIEKLAEKTIDGTSGLIGGAIDQLL